MTYRILRKFLFFAIFLGWSAPLAWAQSEAVLKDFFEGRSVVVKIDMPATKFGIDVFPEIRSGMDYSKYAAHLKQHGTAVKKGESTMITKVKVKEKHVEFHLGGGGFGTLTDDAPGVPVETAAKTEREKRIEKEYKNAPDRESKKKLKEELDLMKKDRERENARLRAMAAQAEEQRKANLREQASASGSRFNIRYGQAISPQELTPTAVMEALWRYLDFPPEEFGRSLSSKPDSLPAKQDEEKVRGVSGAPVTSLRKGMSRQEVDSLLGDPQQMSKREQAGLEVVTCLYRFNETRTEAEFVQDVLIRFSVDSD